MGDLFAVARPIAAPESAGDLEGVIDALKYREGSCGHSRREDAIWAARTVSRRLQNTSINQVECGGVTRT